MSKEQVAAKIEELNSKLNQRVNQLIAADPLCQNLAGQIAAYKVMLTPDKEDAQ